MPRPTGAAAAELDARVREVAARNRRPGHDPTVRVRRVKPQPRKTAAEYQAQRAAEIERRHYPGWSPEPRTCRRDGCENEFTPTSPNQGYCTIACRDEAVRAQRRITDKGKRERRKRQQPAATRICRLDGCTVEFTPEHPRSAYCSPEHKAEGLRQSKARYAKRATAPVPPIAPITEEAIKAIEELEARLGGKLPELQRDYLVILWQRVNTDPACPQHVYDRLERLLGVSAAPGSTMPAPDAPA